MPAILVFAGSIRTGSYNRLLGRAVADALAAAGAEVTFADLRDYPMPVYDGDLEAAGGLPPNAKVFKELLRAHEIIVIASPEYNGSFTALLKNAIDWTSRPEPGEPPLAVYRGKTAAILSASPGAGGGRRGLRHLRELLEMMGVQVIAEQVSIARSNEAFDGAGHLLRPEDAAALHAAVSTLLHQGTGAQRAA
jgi:NAD(P)H-dependent FMN reductase